MVEKECGFSVLELLIVASILSISALISVSRLSGLDDFQLRAEAIQLADEIRYLQNASRTVYRKNDFAIDKKEAENNKLMLENEGYYLILNNKIKRKHYLTGGISIKNNVFGGEVKYKANGMVSSPCTITLKKGNKNLYIILDVVGRVRISDEASGAVV